MKNNKTLETIISFINWLTSWTWVPSQIVISKTHDLKSHSLILLKKKNPLFHYSEHIVTQRPWRWFDISLFFTDWERLFSLNEIATENISRVGWKKKKIRIKLQEIRARLLLKVQTQIGYTQTGWLKSCSYSIIKKRQSIIWKKNALHQHTKQNVGVEFLSVYTPSG